MLEDMFLGASSEGNDTKFTEEGDKTSIVLYLACGCFCFVLFFAFFSGIIIRLETGQMSWFVLLYYILFNSFMESKYFSACGCDLLVFGCVGMIAL